MDGWQSSLLAPLRIAMADPPIFHPRSLTSSHFTSKRLNATFSSVSEDSVDLSPISEILDANPNDDVIIFIGLIGDQCQLEPSH